MQVSKVILKDGRSLDSTLVVVGVGAKPLLQPFKGLLEEEKGGFKVCVPVDTFYCAGTLILYVKFAPDNTTSWCAGMSSNARTRKARCVRYT